MVVTLSYQALQGEACCKNTIQGILAPFSRSWTAFVSLLVGHWLVLHPHLALLTFDMGGISLRQLKICLDCLLYVKNIAVI